MKRSHWMAAAAFSLCFAITPSAWAAKDYVTIGAYQMSTPSAVPFSELDEEATGTDYAYQDEEPDVQQIYYQREIEIAGSRDAPLYLNFGIDGLWMSTEQIYLSGLGGHAGLRYGRRVTLELGLEGGTVRGTLAGERDDGTQRFERLTGSYLNPYYLKIGVEGEFDRVSIRAFYIQKKFNFSVSPEFPSDDLSYYGGGFALGFPF